MNCIDATYLSKFYIFFIWKDILYFKLWQNYYTKKLKFILNIINELLKYYQLYRIF